MFENIIGHERTITRIATEIAQETLPSSLLFYGPEYSGKLTVALELARVLTCRKDGVWNCPCQSCRQQRELAQPNTLLIGGRYFLQEIAVCSQALQSHPKDATLYLFVRAVRKLLRRYDDVLWSGDESRLAKAGSALSAIEERLALFVPGQAAPPADKMEKATKEILEQGRKALAAAPLNTIPIHVVRSIRYWSHLSSGGRGKVVIIENADRMNESSRNALLKILEEPPPAVSFILLTSHRSAIMPTILSRVRPYPLPRRPEETEQSVIRRIFREDQLHYGSVREFFLKGAFASTGELDVMARQFLEAVLEAPSSPGAEVVGSVGSALKSAVGEEGLRYFLEELSELCRGILSSGDNTEERGTIALDRLERWNELIREHSHRAERLNISQESVLESLFYTMRIA